MTSTFVFRSAVAMLAASAFIATSASAQNNKKPAAKPDPSAGAVLLGQFGDWGAYRATPEGKKVCFALSKPTSATIEPSSRKRDPSYAFVSTRPAEKVKN